MYSSLEILNQSMYVYVYILFIYIDIRKHPSMLRNRQLFSAPNKFGIASSLLQYLGMISPRNDKRGLNPHLI